MMRPLHCVCCGIYCVHISPSRRPSSYFFSPEFFAYADAKKITILELLNKSRVYCLEVSNLTGMHHYSI